MGTNDHASSRENRQAADRIARLQAVTAAFSESLTPAQVAEVVTQQGVAALEARAGSMALLTPEGTELELIRTAGYPEQIVEKWRRFPANLHTPLSDAVRTGQPVYLESVAAWAAAYPEIARTGSSEGGAWAAIPLLAEGRAVGALGFTFSHPRTFSDEDRAFIQALARQCAQALERARLYEAAQKARGEAEAARRRMAFLAEASEAASASLDYGATLTSLARLTVPELADWCAVDMRGEDGAIQRLAVAHVDPAKVEWARELQRRYPPDPDAPGGVPAVLRSGQSEFYPAITDDLLVATARDAESLALMREIGFASAMIVPLSARGRTLGALSFVTTNESGRRYNIDDLAFAEELARRAALAVDNARLYQEAQKEIAWREQAEIRFRATFEQAAVGMAEVALDGHWLRVNRRLCEKVGYTHEEMLRLTFQDITHPDDLDTDLELTRALLAGEIPHYALEKRYIRKDGSVAWVNLTVGLVRDARGEPQYFSSVIEDISARRKAEQALRQSEARLAGIIESAMDAILTVDSDQRITVFNPAAERMFGYAAGEAVGQPLSRFVAEGFHTACRRDGTEFPIEATISRVTIGERAFYTAIVRDITDRVQAEAERRAQHEKDRRIAETLQRSLLMTAPANAFPGLEVESFYEAALAEAAVGGDFFDFFSPDTGRVALVVGDVSGKGLASAEKTSEAKYALRAFLRESPDPALALGRLNRFLCSTGETVEWYQLSFIALALAVMETASGRVTIAVGGAEPPLLLGAEGDAHLMETGGLPLGIEPGADYVSETAEMGWGDTLLMTTDGITEARAGRGPLLGQEGLIRLAREARRAPTLRIMGDTLLGAAKAFAAGSLRDDVCLLLARRKDADR